MSGLWATVAYQYLSRLWWLVGCGIVGAVLATLIPRYAEPVLFTVFAAWPFISFYAWDRADRQRRMGIISRANLDAAARRAK